MHGRKRTEKGATLLRIEMRTGETSEKLVQRFKRSVAKEGILRQIKKRKFYEKPSEERRREQREQEKAIRRNARKKAMKEAHRRTRSR